MILYYYYYYVVDELYSLQPVNAHRYRYLYAYRQIVSSSQ